MTRDNDYDDFSKCLCDYLLYRALEGKKRPPRKTALRCWMDKQDYDLKKMKEGVETEMTSDRKLVLDEIGFPWKLSVDERWNSNYQELVAFHRTNGHCRVPRDVDKLGIWVMNQRAARKKKSLADDRICKLDSIGFEWDLNDWKENFRQLAAFKESHGHCRVPRKGKYCSLGRWVSHQRERVQMIVGGKDGTMTEEQMEMLEGVGFWDDE